MKTIDQVLKRLSMLYDFSKGLRAYALPKFVASQTRTAFPWNDSHLVRDAAAEVPALKQRFAGELQVHGSGELAQTLIQNDLIDEYRLLVFSVYRRAGSLKTGSFELPEK